MGRLELDLLLRLTHCRPWASHFPFQNFPPNQGQSFPLELVWCGLNGIKCAQSGVDNLLTKCLLNEQVNYFIEHLVGGRHCSRCGDMLMKKTGKPRLLEPSIIAEKQTMRNEIISVKINTMKTKMGVGETVMRRLRVTWCDQGKPL